MRKMISVYFMVLFLSLLVACNGAEIPEVSDKDATKQESSEQLTVHYIDAGQGDATLLEGPDFTILIDTGRHDRDDVVPYLQQNKINEIDLLIATHPHADHIGQLDKVMQSFTVNEVWMSGDTHTSRTFERAIDAVLSSEATYYEPRAGEVFEIGSVVLEVLHPHEIDGDLNEGSISVRVTYGDIRFLFTGDVEKRGEEEMIKRGHDLDANILQLGHHGSSTSSTTAFLQAVQPEVAIYSAGHDNDYGHPHQEIVARVQQLGIPLYGTDVHGTIFITTDGTTYEVNTEKEGKLSNEEKITTNANCVDINSASIEELQSIIHLGEELSEQLISLRPFASMDELTKINGIGQGRLKDIKNENLACVK
ncbi:MBL fold metallo-hydrolase [Anaerobacillus sp. MEB173]|uniref:MBL fold metallo-hydrolase n=1 Tax=Anaerobacillus sp. MEB173 TaxID=3383345 RepID=UPI003F9129C1